MKFRLSVARGKVNQQGQVVIILLLVMVVTLGIGLSLVGRSTTEIATSFKGENASRAFSAAEAGIEKALMSNLPPAGTPVPTIAFNLSNQATAETEVIRLPVDTRAIEYPPFGKEAFAQFWLVKPNDIATPFYTNNSFDLYFGDPAPFSDTNYYTTHPDDKPAVKVHIISWNGDTNQYVSQNELRDSYSGTGDGRNGITGCNNLNSSIATNESDEAKQFYCQATITISPTPSATIFPVLVRVRILYSNLRHPVALKPSGGSLPPQARIVKSVGKSGDAQRVVQVFREENVMPQFFDYVLFSATNLSKPTTP